MKELVIVSGKGGTGKTSLTAEFAAISDNIVLCDADVDAADLHLLMKPDIKQRTDFKGGGLAVINPDKCTECGLCIDLCRFSAVKKSFEIDEIECEGCGVCVDLCPEQAIAFPIKTCGEWYISETRFGPMVHARLGIAEENSGKLVALVRHEAKKLADENNIKLIITDGPPGVGCPVIAAIGGASALLIVTEPTVSGLHDMERAIELAEHFNVSPMVCVNKFDLNYKKTAAIEKYCKNKKIKYLGKIPFDRNFTEAMVHGKTFLEYNNTSDVNLAIKKMWTKIVGLTEMNNGD